MVICIVTSLLTNTSAAQNVQWQFESQREEIAPRSWRDSGVRYDGRPTLALAGGGKDIADGRWAANVSVESRTYYRFRSEFLSRNVEEPGRSVLARILWLDSQGELLAPAEYPATRRDVGADGWNTIEEIYESPEGAAAARLELVYRWDADGEVFFAPAVLEPVTKPEPRLVRLAAVRYRPRHDRTLQENLDEFSTLIAEAAALGADIVCLPEGITLAGTGKSYVGVSEPVPGPTSEFLGRIASRHGVYIVAGILERDGEAVYNTAILIGRNGTMEGSYRKVTLPREEIDGGVTPGYSFPTFDTDFGRIGVMICWDVAFPEPARQLALGGAEVILMPIWGGNTILARARAIENQVYLVSSSYDMETGIFDHEGELIAEAETEGSVAVVEVDLNSRTNWPWIGDFGNRIPREIPPRTALQ